MATLVAMAYPGEPGGALRAALDLEDLPIAESSDLDDAVVVTVDDRGKTHLTQATHLTSEGAIYGALGGMIVGVLASLLFPALKPIAILGVTLGASVVGLLLGALIGHNRDIGIADDFVRIASANLPANSSALFVLLEGERADDVLAELATCGGELLTTDLPSKDAQRLRLAARRAQRKRSVRAL